MSPSHSQAVSSLDLANVYSLRYPLPEQRLPVVFDIPRSGREYPGDFRAEVAFSDLHSSVSKHVERLYEGVTAQGAAWLYARFPNVYIDVNRSESDLDVEMLDGAWHEPVLPSDKTRAGIGLIPRLVRGNRPIYGARLLGVDDVRNRIEGFYRPYHDRLSALLLDAVRLDGFALHLSCHSMASRGPAKDGVPGLPRSEFDLGDRHGQTSDPEFMDLLETTLKGFGYQVSRNAHFAGAECVRRHGNPAAGVSSVQIEMRRDLFVDEETGLPNAGFAKVQSHMTELAAAVRRYALVRCGRGLPG